MSLQMIFMGVNFHQSLLDTLEHQVGTRALIQAKEIASDPNLIQEVRIKNIPAIERIINRLTKISDASFIVIGDDDGTRLSHPVKEKIGLPMQGGDNAAALENGESYISVSKGSLGYGVRGKSAIVDFDGEIIGVVSVGYLFNRFDQWLVFYAKPVSFELGAILLLTLIGAWLFSSHIKKKMNGMEPAEIALALYLQRSILQSVYEGIIAIDKTGKILAVNKSAIDLLGTDKEVSEIKNRSILEYLNHTQFFFQTPYEENIKDEIVSINGKTLIANRVAIFDRDLLIGWVISFRHKNDINSLTAELTQIKQYTDNLRVMRHEHANKLSTISGLIEIGEYESALSLINNENTKKQQLIDFIRSRIKCKQVAGILLGKYARSQELGLQLQFDPTCQLYNLPDNIDDDELSAIIGNLIDNAFEATLKNPESDKVITLLITDAGKELVIEIGDNGCGIDPEIAGTIFNRGVTSKNDDKGHGIGLYLINRYVTNAGGVILVDNAEPKGTIFSIFIPKNGNR
ncbi:ATPase [Vibrio diazotrophicus]|uniref:histidine kinase n=2 Tax=Vibrionaceae TaxID=641 RepID=A0A2J8HLV6_VIBDI|nr:ATPase [Vibrio diazotrophicus]PNH95104.1 ATPase [Vibrio diazotrophicus]PNH96717.1 ATPase [Vibrio diazotrophicus]PNH99200.1 ATPase [Vibrio diazotrophicus]PNI05517.1 ATPase [Vibrio diazotrophicus]